MSLNFNPKNIEEIPVAPNFDWTILYTLALLVKPQHACSNKVDIYFFDFVSSFSCHGPQQIYSTQPETEDWERISCCSSAGEMLFLCSATIDNKTVLPQM